MKNKTLLAWLFLFGGILGVYAGAVSSVKDDEKIEMKVLDNEPIYFCDWFGRVEPIKGIIYNAIDKDYIADKHGFTLRTHHDKTKNTNTGGSDKTFQLICIDRYINPAEVAAGFDDQVSSLSDAQNFDYSINKYYPFVYQRILVWALMPKAIEKVEYKTLQQRKDENLDYYEGVKNPLVCFTLRSSWEYNNTDYYPSVDKGIIYVINGIEIPEKVFDALNPIFIRSLNRIKDKEELSKYNREGLNGVVQIETFTHEEIIAPNKFIYNEKKSSRFFVNEVEVTFDIFLALKPSFFKETQVIQEKNENYRYIKGKHPQDNPKTITIHKAYI